MESRILGKTGLRVSALGMGCGSIARDVDRDVGIATLHRALDLGINYFDTAPQYSSSESERRVGEGLGLHPLGADVTVATKVGQYPQGFDYSYDATLRSVYDSLERLRVSKLRLVQIHGIWEEIWEPVMRPGGTLEALRKLQAEGLIEHVGVTGGEEMPTLLRAVETGEFETLLIWRHLHLLDRSAERALLPAARARGIGIVVASPYAGQILATGPIPEAEYLHEPAREIHKELTRGIQTICARHGVSMEGAALQFVGRAPGVSVTLAGYRRPEEVDVAYRAFHEPLPETLWVDLEQTGEVEE